MHQAKDQKKQGSQQIPQKLWHSLVPADFVFKTFHLELTAEQSKKIIASQTSADMKNILTSEQKSTIEKALLQSPSKAIYLKVNGRTPKDLPLINRQIHKVEDVLQIIHASQYLLQNIHKDQTTNLTLREFIPQLTDNSKIFDVFVRGGFTLAIGQKICDHIEQEPTEKEIDTIISAVQTIMPAITLVSKSKQLNSFLASIYCKEQTLKITSIRKYPPYPKDIFEIFNEDELEKYFKEIQQNKQHKSEQQKYFQNEGIIPLIRTVKKEEDVKNYDMGAYLMGNQIDDQEKLEQWKQFIKQANKKLGE